MNKFNCKRCGQCCGVAPFTKKEYKEAKKAAAKLGVSLVKQYIGNKPYYIPRSIYNKMNQPLEQVIISVKTADFDCPFLGKNEAGNHYCKIYNIRPEICRLFGSYGHLSEELKCPNQ